MEALVFPVTSAFFRFLARAFEGSESQSGVAGGMIEHDLSFVQNIIKSSGFRDDPTTLDNISLPWK
jgi:hypothetical protein